MRFGLSRIFIGIVSYMYTIPESSVGGWVVGIYDLDDAADTRNHDLTSNVPCGPISIQSLSHARQHEVMTDLGGSKLVS